MSSIGNNIMELENEIAKLSATLEQKKKELKQLRESDKQNSSVPNINSLTNSEISRFSRQIILPEIGVKGQITLRNASVLIVGAGGLGKNRTKSFFNWFFNHFFIKRNRLNVF